MAKTDFLPSGDGELLVWLQNFSSKLGNYQALFGLSAGEVAGIVADYELLRETLFTCHRVRELAQAWTAFKNSLLHGSAAEPPPTVLAWPAPFPLATRAAGLLARVRAIAARIRVHPAYTVVSGTDLGIIGPAPSAAALRPRVRAAVTGPFTVSLRFAKLGHDGVEIESQRAGETDWTHLAFDAFSPYVDARPPLVAGQPEERRYRLRYRDGEEAVGAYSDIVTIVVGP